MTGPVFGMPSLFLKTNIKSEPILWGHVTLKIYIYFGEKKIILLELLTKPYNILIF